MQENNAHTRPGAPPPLPPVQEALDRLQKLSAIMPLEFEARGEKGRITTSLVKDGLLVRGETPTYLQERIVTWRELALCNVDPLWAAFELVLSKLKEGAPCK